VAASAGETRVEFGEPLILTSGDYALVSFDQHYWSDQREDRGRKRLYLMREEGDGYRILGEDWQGETLSAAAPSVKAAEAPRPTPTPVVVRRKQAPLVADELRAELDGNSVAVSFRLQPSVRDGRASTGRLVVVVASKSGRHYAYPGVPLVDGRPAQPGQGEWYSIRRFKIVKARFGPLEPGDGPAQIAYYVYNRDGELVLERSLAWPGS